MSSPITPYRPDPKIHGLGGAFYDVVEATDFPGCIARFVNKRWAERVGLDLDEGQWAAHFCRFEPLPDNLPDLLALKYHGHQFRVYNPEIGDGRGFLHASDDARERRRERGQHPSWSRSNRAWHRLRRFGATR